MADHGKIVDCEISPTMGKQIDLSSLTSIWLFFTKCRIKIFQSADLSVKVPICLKSGADLSQCRYVFVSADMSSIPST